MRKNAVLMAIVVVALVIFALTSVALSVGAAAEVNHLSVDGAWVLKETIKDPVVLGKESKDYYNFHGGISEYSGYYSYDWTSQSRDSKGNVIDTFCTGQVHLQSNWTTPPSTLVPGQTMKTDVEASFTSSHEDIKGHFTCDRKRIGGQCAKLTVTGRGFVPIKRGTCVDGYTKELSKKSSETIEWLVPQGIHGDTLEIIFHPFTTGMAGSMWNTGIHFIYEYKEESSTTTPAWCDYFDSTTLDPLWSWEREDPTRWSLTERPGYLRITTQRCDLYQAHNTAKNLLLTPAPSGDFEVTTHVTINPSANYQAATLFVYQDDDNHLTLSRQYASMWGGQQVFFCKEVEGRCDAPHGVSDGCDLTTVYLKITKQGTTYTGYWSTDGSRWTKVYQYKDIKFSNLKIGCIGWHGESSAAEIPADFDYICVAPIGAVPTPTPTPTPTPAPTPAPTPGKLKKCVGDQPYLYVEDKVMGKGKTVEIPIMMCNAKDLANMDLDWSYNAVVLKVIDVTKGSLNKKALFDWNEVSAGKLKISFASSKGVTGSKNSIAVMKFEVVGNPGATSTLTGTVTTASKTDGSKITVGVNPGKFTVGSSPVKGDCDGDGKLTVKDALAALQISVGKMALDMCYDYNGDGKVNSADAREMLKAIVGKK